MATTRKRREPDATAESPEEELPETGAPEAAETEETAPAEVPPAPARVSVHNPDLARPRYVPTVSGLVRLGPKESRELLLTELIDETHTLAAEGGVLITNL